ncbi:MAG TPA: acetyl-CoA carboxylase biotin carboxylase subunit [Thermomicrobiales bacterium]|nr:acetyl-CoA carboxylase biotin carboxylase subunit [Thermomicrobiales bacterium]
MASVNDTMQRVLIANRGEIAVRVIRACRELGIEPVAIYGEGEENALHVREAADAYRIPPGAGLPYLDIPAIVDIAKRAGVQAVHPGYGFLAENAAFAEAVEAAGLIFVGPPAAAIQAMGDKVEARRIAIAAGVPVVPGSEGPVESVDAAREWADANGYPVAVKAAGGGGGRGFRVARTPDDLAEAFLGSSGEAKRYFGNPTVYLERYLERPRHIEIQIFADAHGHVLALGERDCSLQRRHQKLVEETPSPAVTPEQRAGLFEAAVALARAVDYRGAGTCEFLLADDGRFYFLEMNTRIQVEHTVTEEVTGLDLVKEQFRVAAGEPLSFTEQDIQPRGHAIECRINAEDAGNDFKPAPGIVVRYRPPGGPGVRVDSAMEDGAAILPLYDSLIAKLIVWGRDRSEALDRMRRALEEFEVDGVPTTIPFHLRVVTNPDFADHGPTTAFLPEHPEVIPPPSAITAAPETADHHLQDVLVEVNGRRLTVRLPENLVATAPATATRPRNGSPQRPRPSIGTTKPANADSVELPSPIQGTVIRIAAQEGGQVTKGDLICVVEAMKMENEIVAHRDGTIASLPIQMGDAVKIGAVLATIE